ncbi:MAG TPA: RES family NAD+ phosphorylase [Geminicoccaceae bacterium]
MIDLPPQSRVRWSHAWRIIASRYPPIQLFERLSDDPADWEALAEVESLTNPRIRDEIGAIRLVPAEERVAGPGASWVMASFTHLSPHGSRFSDGSYGVYYAAHELPTAIAETVYHMGRFYGLTRDPPHGEDMRVLTGAVATSFHDLRGQPAFAACLDPEDYGPSRALGAQLKARGSNGVVYPSVRRAGGQCLGAFRPKAVGLPRQERHLRYHWNGERIDRYFDYAEDRWIGLGA